MALGPEPSIAGIMEAWDSGGFDGMAAKAAELSGANAAGEERHRIAQAFYATFATTAGRQVLEHLLNWTLRRSSWYVPGAALESGRTAYAPNQADILAYGLQREGQNMIVALIMDMLIEAERDPPGGVQGESS